MIFGSKAPLIIQKGKQYEPQSTKNLSLDVSASQSRRPLARAGA
jgi:hypothetical protein